MKMVDEDCGVVPYNALVMTPANVLVKNTTFSGLLFSYLPLCLFSLDIKFAYQIEIHMHFFSLSLFKKTYFQSLSLYIYRNSLSLSLSLWANLHHDHVCQMECLKNLRNGFLLVIKGPKFIDELDSYCHLFKGYHEAPISKDLPGNSLFFLFIFFTILISQSCTILNHRHVISQSKTFLNHRYVISQF